MTITLFMTLLLAFSGVVSLITEAVKKFLDSISCTYSSNVVVLIVATIVGAGGTALMYLLLGIAFTLPNICCMVLMAIAVWVGAMVGYDKVLQMVKQLKNMNLK